MPDEHVVSGVEAFMLVSRSPLNLPKPSQVVRRLLKCPAKMKGVFVMAVSRVNVRWVLAVMVAFGLAIGATALRAKAEDKEKEKEENEVKVKFEEVPAAVQATLKKESGGATIETVDKETDDGKTVYEADVKLNGKNYEIR